MREADLPAEHPTPQEAPRISPPNVHPRGSGDPEGPPPSRSGPSLRLTGRVRDHATFAALSRARPRHSGPVTVRSVATAPDQPAQVAYAVSRRVGGAVARNRLRRRLRAAVASRELAPGRAHLVAAGPEALTMPFAELDAAVHGALRGTR
jgi:ribonuclease P protein component